MTSILNLGAKLVADVNGYISDMKNAGQATTGTKDSIGSLASQAFIAVGGIAAVSAALVAVARYMEAAEQAANAFNETQAKQDAILKATGGDAGVTSEQLKQLTDELSLQDGISKKVIMDEESMMLTFTNISDNVFPRAIKDALDLQTVFGSVESATKALGLALNDPTNGLTALSRVGIRFDADQKTQIDNFVKENDLAAAQGIILDVVEQKFGGTAAAMEKASDGADRLKVAQENLNVIIGQGLTGPMKGWNEWLANNETQLTSTISSDNDYQTALNAVAAAQGISTSQMITAMIFNGNYRKTVEELIDAQLRLNEAIAFHNAEAAGDIPVIQQENAVIVGATKATDAEWKSVAQLRAEAYNATPAIKGLTLAEQAMHDRQVTLTTILKTIQEEGGGVGETPPHGAANIPESRQAYGPEIVNSDQYTASTDKLDKAQAKLLQDTKNYPTNAPLIKKDTQAINDQSVAVTKFGTNMGKTSQQITNDQINRIIGDKNLTEAQKQQELLQLGNTQQFATDTITQLLLINTNVMDLYSSWNKLFVDRHMDVAITYSGGGVGYAQAQVEGSKGGSKPPKAAAGGDISGLAMVGEHGEELVNLPPGSHVYPNDETKKILRALGVPGMMMGGAGGGPAGPGEWAATVGPGAVVAGASSQDSNKKADDRSARTEDKVSQLADAVTSNQQDVQKSNMELKSTITDLKDAIKKMAIPQIDYARLTRAIRDANQQVGLR